MQDIPLWISELDPDELQFIKRFVLASGSLKEIADVYGVSYPTVRSRLNAVIGKVNRSENKQEDTYVSLIKKMAMDGKLDFEAASVLIHEYRKRKEDANDHG